MFLIDLAVITAALATLLSIATPIIIQLIIQ